VHELHLSTINGSIRIKIAFEQSLKYLATAESEALSPLLRVAKKADGAIEALLVRSPTEATSPPPREIILYNIQLYMHQLSDHDQFIIFIYFFSKK
jgi:hypothetical protein